MLDIQTYNEHITFLQETCTLTLTKTFNTKSKHCQMKLMFYITKDGVQK